MLLLKCTTDVQKQIGLPKEQLLPAVPADALLGHWMVNRFHLERRQAFIFMSESTLLSFILLQGRVGLTPQRTLGWTSSWDVVQSKRGALS